MEQTQSLHRSAATLLIGLVGLLAGGAAGRADGAPPGATGTVRTEEVELRNGETPLAGVVLVPATEEPVPGVVLIHGSGESDRTQTWASAFARGLAERGIAVLLPDKRGSGASGGDWKTASFEVLADDALAGVEALQGVDGVDGRRVGVLGLSQGGHIAPLAARRSSEVAFVVDVSGSAVPISEQVIDEVEKLARRQGFTPEQVERVNALHRLGIRYGLTGEGWEEYEAALTAALESGLAGHGVVEPFPRDRDHWVWAWARAVGDYDPLPHWKALDVPALVLYGGEDTQIHVPESVDLLLEATAEASLDLTLTVFGDAGHGLSYRRGHEYGIRPEVLGVIAAWIREAESVR
ncbi:MAG: alpha/beta hydrolase family protein [Thermoanaerobaculia bacterium]